jgi:hypothetical protein
VSRFVDDEERRGRLGRRHRLAPSERAVTSSEVAQSLTAVHGTDPGSTVLGILARTRGAGVTDIERALYDDRSIVRLLGMRRTVFAVDWELASAVWTSSANVVREQLRLLDRMLSASGIENPEQWIREAEARLLVFLESNPGSTSTEIASADPYLGHRVPLGDPAGTTQSVTSRLLTHMSADGRVVRARPRGGWTSTQFTWATAASWRDDWPARPDIDAADASIASSWLYGYGPALLEDFAWWAGWPKGRARKAIDRAGGVEIATSDGIGYLLESDREPVPPPEPWIAFLPGLDSSTMGWKRRNFYLGQYAERLFDDVGNGGPTVWVDGHVVGGWTQIDDGNVVYELFEEIGRERQIELDSEASRLTELLGDVRLKPRARRWTRSERDLREKHAEGAK